MPKRSVKEDANQAAYRIVQEATGQAALTRPEKKNPAAVALGRLGGKKGGPARAALLSKKQLSAIGKKGAQARWSRPPSQARSPKR
jgi:hypothetical protein